MFYTRNIIKYLCRFTPHACIKIVRGGIFLKKGQTHMNEEELKAKEEELKAKEKALTEKETTLTEKETELSERETALEESDTGKMVKKVKEGYEKKMADQQAEFDKRLKNREAVINNLLENGNANEPQPTFVDKINAQRIAQNKKW